MNKYYRRVTESARGERFNLLMWPSLLTTMAYGIGFVVFGSFDSIHHSSLFMAMNAIHPILPFAWGIIAIVTIVVGFTFLLFNIPPAGRASGLVGFMVWIFAGIVWILTGGVFLTFAIAIPNMWFWIWQYFSLSKFRRQDIADAATMRAYDRGDYDAVQNPPRE